MDTLKFDFVVIGSGLAGLTAALKLSQRGRVGLLSKAELSQGNTPWAQGGIASVALAEDSFDSHIRDTLLAGAGLCDDGVVTQIIEEAPARIAELQAWGVPFDQHITLEGGHSHRRIWHVEDHTGREIHQQILLQVRKRASEIKIFSEHVAIDLILNEDRSRCVGVYAFRKEQQDVIALTAGVILLSTGGAGKVYRYTSNWEGATGDGIAMAYRAGVSVSNLEFMQFHPTCLYHPLARNFLISEALRGEGGQLINRKGERFMAKYDSRGELAPRDIVARSIDAEMKKSGDECVYLDMRQLGSHELKKHFPVIYERCFLLGIDMATAPIPVVPAAHYLCGGVATTVSGKTSLRGLYVIGETACTGLHGANRLASNSLLECLVMAHLASAEILANQDFREDVASPRPWVYPRATNADEMIVIHHMWEEIRSLMWNYVGIVRSNKRLERASHRLTNLMSEVREYYSEFQLHPDILELRNIAQVADLTVRCASERKESRGIHYNIDYPLPAAELKAVSSLIVPPR